MKIDHIYCINLDTRADRWQKMDEQFSRLRIDAHRFPASTGLPADHNPRRKTLGQIGCLKSHCAVIKDAMAKGYKQIMVLEDDVVFCDDFHERLAYCTKKLPDNWDTLYLGGTIIAHQPVQVAPFIFRNRQTYGAFAFIIRDTVFQELIALYESHQLNADDCHAERIQRKYNSYIIIPFLTHIRKDVSSVIEGEITSDNLFQRIYQYYKPKEEFSYAHFE